MADLIDRNTFILSLKTRRAEAYLSELDDCDTEEEKCRINDEMYYSTQSFIDVMKCQPVVDAVPVIRCKNCKYAKHDTEYLIDENLYYCVWHEESHNPNWYCADGERKDCEQENVEK